LKQRFYSLDVFRGATVTLMILVNNPGSWSYIYAPLEHAPWHGCTPTDLVFPFFLFAVGNALAFVVPRYEVREDGKFLGKIISRTLIIFAIGLFLNWFPFIKWSGGHLVFRPWADPVNGAEATGVRILGVLQRIALAYFFASLIIYYGKLKGAFMVSAVILLGYWALCLLAGTPGDPFSIHGYFGTSIDKAILGVPHMYKGEGFAFDPEGLASTLPAIVQVIFGYFTGHYIVQKGKTTDMISGLFVIGCVLVFTGFCWDMVFPINKKIWSSSFVLYTTGLAILVLCVLLHTLDIRGKRGAWSRFFDVFGKNALFIFVISGVLPRIYSLFRIADGIGVNGEIRYKGVKEWMYDHLFAPVFGQMNGSLLYAIFNILILWVLCYWLDKRKIYIKV
jgi:predicted acyltransferase